LRPAAFFWAVVPPWLALLLVEEACEAFLPRLDAPGEFAILAARAFDIPFSFRFSYCFAFLTLGRLPGMRSSFAWTECVFPERSGRESRFAGSRRVKRMS